MWFSRRFPGRSPYRLYALSNAGSLLGLLSYPFLVEPNFALSLQSKTWSGFYVVFALCCGFIAFKSGRQGKNSISSTLQGANPPAGSSGQDRPGGLPRLLWLVLAAAGSTVLLATTNQVSEEIAVIPFLWVLPLSIYLLTFILCFSSQWFYSRPLFVATAAAILWFVGRTVLKMPAGQVGGVYNVGIIEQMSVYCFALFLCCMLCHGELVKLKPGTEYLTQFYLAIAIGGALGGVFVGIVAPHFFRVLWELYIGYFVCGGAVLVAALHDRRSWLNLPGWGWGLRIVAAIMVVFLGVAPFFLLIDRLPQNQRNAVLAVAAWLGFDGHSTLGSPRERTVAIRRNFYGILRVVEVEPYDSRKRLFMLFHGQTVHGLQLQYDEGSRKLATTYYSKDSGVGLAIMNHRRYKSDNGSVEQMRVGMIGLGAGTVAAYGREGDYYRIYEMNPAVVELAAAEKGYFSFVRDCKAKVDIILGDARLSLENEAPQRFDVLALDAFCGGTPPVHLLTKEAFNIYQRHIRDGGIIALHISNRYLDLGPVIWKLADEFGLSGVIISPKASSAFSYEAEWILLTKDEEFLRQKEIGEASTARIPEKDLDSIPMWTDDYSNLWPLIQ